jgi:hypothetical protein
LSSALFGQIDGRSSATAKKEKLNDPLFQCGIIMEKDHLDGKEKWRQIAEEQAWIFVDLDSNKE